MAGARGATPCRRERHRARGLGVRQRRHRVLRERVSNWSDQLMMFILRARRPEVYRENLHANHVGNIAHLVTVSLIGGAQPSRLHGLPTHQLQSLVHTTFTPASQVGASSARQPDCPTSRERHEIRPNPGFGLWRGALCTPLAKSHSAIVDRGRRSDWPQPNPQSLNVKCQPRGSKTSKASRISPEGDNQVDDAR